MDWNEKVIDGPLRQSDFNDGFIRNSGVFSEVLYRRMNKLVTSDQTLAKSFKIGQWICLLFRSYNLQGYHDWKRFRLVSFMTMTHFIIEIFIDWWMIYIFSERWYVLSEIMNKKPCFLYPVMRMNDEMKWKKIDGPFKQSGFNDKLIRTSGVFSEVLYRRMNKLVMGNQTLAKSFKIGQQICLWFWAYNMQGYHDWKRFGFF